jgi:hypothetical protein
MKAASPSIARGEPGRDADREVDQEQRPEEARQPEPGVVPGPVPDRLHDGHERPETERQGDEEEVVDRRGRKLDSCKIDSRRGDRGHLATKLETAPSRRIVQ